jgi:hypothetical protein
MPTITMTRHAPAPLTIARPSTVRPSRTTGEHGLTHAQEFRDAQRTAARGNGVQFHGRTNPDAVQECTDTRMSTHAGMHRYSDAGAHKHTHARCGLL